jgi:hypothetical protein
MKKDVIYIDIEDDITSIIQKVKSASAKIVALVPPKRIGSLQSAVNLKLLQKAATSADKRVVIITNDHSLSALAAGVKIPVAKNLQSKPEIAPIPEPDDEDSDVIKGDELPVGDLAGASVSDPQPPSVSEAAKAASDSLDESTPEKSAAKVAAAGGLAAAKDRPKKGVKGLPKVPNFDIFRKNLFLIIGGIAALIIFLVWALAFAPRATVTVTAKTNANNYNQVISLDPKAPTDISALKVKPEVKQIKKQNSTEFDTTGSKDIGNKASGSITVTNCEYPAGFTIPAGTAFRSTSGQEFVTTGSNSIPGYTQQSKCNQAQKSVAVEAASFGPEFNLAAGEYDMAGEGGNITANGGAMAGGTREKVQVVSEEDVEKAKQALGAQDANQVKGELAKQFKGDIIIIQESYTQAQAAPNVQPAIGETAKRAKLTVEITYTLVAINRDDAKSLVNDSLNNQIKDKDAQRIYSSGDRTIRFSEFQKLDGDVYSVRINTVGYIGPAIDDKKLAKELVGKNYGEIEQHVNAIQGVEKVDIRFSPFWVTTAPGVEKINIKFSVLNDAE